MNAVTILDIILGLAFVYLILSLICSSLVEWWSAVTTRRARMLRASVERLLGGAQLAAHFHRHPLIAGLTKASGYPTYISSRTFAQAFVNLTMTISSQSGGTTSVTVKSEGLSAPQKTLVESLHQGSSSVGEIEDRVATWFDGAMERVSGWYKRWTQLWTIILAAGVVWAADVDTLRLARELNQNAALRSALAERAVTAGRTDDIKTLKADLGQLDLPGLSRTSGDSRQTSNGPFDVVHAAGLLITMVAVSLGAPFWFDLLNRLVNLRQTGGKPKTVAEEKPIVGQ